MAGSYLGGHSIFRGATPWWLPAEVPLREAGLLNDKNQLASDRDIVAFFLGQGSKLRVSRAEATFEDRPEAVLALAGRLVAELGAESAIVMAISQLREELSHHSKRVRARYGYILAFANHPEAGLVEHGKRDRPGKRERDAARALRSARHKR